MKVGILTQPLHANYGGLLQNFALQQTLIQAGYDVETIDWASPHSLLGEFKSVIKCLLWPDKYKPLNYTPTKKEIAEIQRNTNYFIRMYIRHTKAMTSLNDFAVQARRGRYEAYIVGSDQCWRPKYNSYLPAMFLGFLNDKDVIRIAYGASFGTDIWEYTEEMTKLCASLAGKFDLITVREDSGVFLCKEHLGVNAIHVLDPTMLLTKEDYIQLVEKENAPQSAGNLFNYILDPDSEKTAFINHVADSLGLIPFKVLPKYQAETRTEENIKNSIEDYVFPKVSTWLKAFMDAEMTIVDSFHGVVFSILFNKPFWVIGNTNRGMSRFTSLLKLLELEDRLINLSELERVDVHRSIDWIKVNNILEQKRAESKDVLFKALK